MVEVAPPPQREGTVSRSRFLIAAVITLLVVVIAFVWVVARNRNPQDTQHAITYQVSGTAAQVAVVSRSPDGDRSEAVGLPWLSSFRASPDMELSLEAHATDGSEISCVLSEDGRIVSTQSGPSCLLQATS